MTRAEIAEAEAAMLSSVRSSSALMDTEPDLGNRDMRECICWHGDAHGAC